MSGMVGRMDGQTDGRTGDGTVDMATEPVSKGNPFQLFVTDTQTQMMCFPDLADWTSWTSWTCRFHQKEFRLC